MASAPSAQTKKAPAMLADTDLLFKKTKAGSTEFLEAVPFPHLLIQTMIKKPCCAAIYEGLQQWQHAVDHKDDFYPQKGLPSVLQMLLWELSSSTLIRHFATLTGTPPLLPDPFLQQGGFCLWQEPSVLHAAAGEFEARHPCTDLQNVLRLELFFAADAHSIFTLELLDDDNEVLSRQSVFTGSLLITNSDRYRVRYSYSDSSRWASLLSYYYINDRARILNGEEQPSAY